MMPKEPEPLWCVCGHANYQHPITNYPSGPNQLPEERSDCEECEECVEFVRDYDLSHMDEEHVHWVPQPVSFEDVLKAGPALTPEGNKAPRRLGLSPEEQAEGVGEEFILQARQWGKGKAEEEHLGHGHISANPNDGPDQARAYTDRVEEEQRPRAVPRVTSPPRWSAAVEVGWAGGAEG